jgi:hypothetical protein
MAVQMADKIWDLANIVTGFSVAQSLATIFMLAKDEMKLLHDDNGYRIMRKATAVYTLFYLAAIILCGVAGAKLDTGAKPDHSDNTDVWWLVTIGRAVAVIFFTGALYGTIDGHRHFKAERAQSKPLLDKQRDFS